MTHKPHEEELTKEAFAARLYAELQGKHYPLWLCTSDEAKQAIMDDFEAGYRRWVKMETDMADLRESERRSSRIEIIDLKDGESPWDFMDRK